MDNDLIKVLIVDDEKEARQLLIHYLKRMPHIIGTIEESENVEDAVYKTISFMPDLILLDILMPGRKGTELMELVEKRELPSHVVVISGSEEPAISAIKSGVYDFLLKPVKKEELEGVINKFLGKRNAGPGKKLSLALQKIDNKQRIRLSTTNSHILFDPDEIVYCEAYGAYTFIYTENGEKELSNNYLGMIEKSFSGLRFFRISRSYLINRDKLLEINRPESTCILASGDKKIKIKGSWKSLKILSELDVE
jgi:two-component system LytT family response regulator